MRAMREAAVVVIFKVADRQLHKGGRNAQKFQRE
jgi:hypothetical protein